MSRLMAYLTLACVLAILAPSCASSSGSSTDQTRLTSEEIAEVDVTSLYEVVQRLRPRWLDVRAARSAFDESRVTQVVVYVDRSLLGGVDELRDLEPGLAQSIEYMDGSQASASLPGLGSRQVEGAIVVHTSDRRN